VADYWLQSARLFREAGLLQSAFSAVLQGTNTQSAALSIEKAKLLWAQGEKHEALTQLQGDLERFQTSEQSKLEYAEASLLVGNWMAETALFHSDNVIQQFKKVTATHKDWEEGYFSLACYYDKLLESDTAKKAAREATTLPHVIENYGQALRHGNTYVIRALPRLLTLWLDYGDRFPDGKTPTGGRIETLTNINTIVSGLCDQLPAYQIYTVISQLSSRICHGNGNVYMILERMLLRLLENFPQQSLWLLISISRSDYALRSRRCHELFSKAKRQVYFLSICSKVKFPSVRAIHPVLTQLTENLLEVCNKTIDKKYTEIGMADICR
jgi:serine/threonine-protein kinase ATR